MSSPRVDNRINVETPEAVDFQLELAGVGPRAAAWFLDIILRGGVLLVVGLVGSAVPTMGTPVAFLVGFAVMWLYYPLFEVFNDGQSPGKSLFELRVVSRDGTPVGWYGAIVRNLVRVADAMPVGYALGVISMLVSGRLQRLGDVAGDTVVVYHGVAAERPVAGALPDAEPVKVPVVLDPDEQEAIVAYAERSTMLSEQRSEELAQILAPLVDAPNRREARRKLHGLAQRIVRWG